MIRVLQEFLIFLLKCMGFVILHIPFRLKRRFSLAVAAFWFYVLPIKKRVALHNVALAFPRLREESMGSFKTRSERLVFGNFVHYVLCALEIVERFRWTEKVVRERVVLHGIEHLRALQAKGTGFFFLTSHLGNWELITLVGVVNDFRPAIITKFLRSQFFNYIWVRSRQSYGLELLEESGSGLAIVKAVRRGRGVGFILDQHTGEPNGIEASFFGLPAWCNKGLAVLSDRLKVGVLPTYLVRLPNGHFEMFVDPPLDFAKTEPFHLPKGGLTDEGLRTHILVCNQNLEKWIRNYPEQYLWIHKRFKNLIDYRSKLAWEI